MGKIKALQVCSKAKRTEFLPCLDSNSSTLLNPNRLFVNSRILNLSTSLFSKVWKMRAPAIEVKFLGEKWQLRRRSRPNPRMEHVFISIGRFFLSSCYAFLAQYFSAPFLLPTPPPLSFPFFSFSFFSLLLLFFFFFRFLFVSFSFPFRFFRVRPRPFSFFSFRFSLVSFFFALFWPCFLFSELSFLAPPFCLSRRPAGSPPGRSDLHVLGTGGVARALAEGGVCWPYVRRAWTDLGAMLALCSPVYVRPC